MGYRLYCKASISGSGAPNYLNASQDLAILGNTVYTVAAESYLSAFDITNAMSGTITHITAGQGGGNYPTGYFAGDSNWNEFGNYAYYAVYNANSFSVWWRGLLGWVVQDELTGAGAPNYLGGALRNSKLGNYAYVASYLEDVISIINVADPFNIFPVTQVALVAPYSAFASGIILSGYRIDVPTGLVRKYTWDITDPTAPVSTGDTLQNATTITYKRITLDGSNIWVAGADSNTLTLFDTACAYQNGVRGDDRGNYELSVPTDVVISGNYAYVLSYNSVAFSVIDLTTLTAVACIRNADDPNYRMNAPKSAAISGNYLYFVCSDGGDQTLVIFDISNPLAPAHVISVDTGDGVYLISPRDIKINGNYAYIINSSSSSTVRPFTVVDISDPYNPTQVGRAHTGPTYGRRIQLDTTNNIAYVLSRDRLDLYDISTLNDDMTWLTWSGWSSYIDNATAIELASNKLALITNSDNDMLSAWFLARTSTFTMDAIISDTGTKTATFTLDAIIQEEKTETFTLDSLIAERKSATFTCDAIIRETKVATFTIDAIIGTRTATFTLDAVIKETKTSTFTIDAIIQTSTDASIVMAAFTPTTYLRGRGRR